MLRREKQKQSNWCWAACLRMAASAFGTIAPEQCTLALQFIPGAVGCCADGSTEACDKPLDERAVPALYSSSSLVADALGPAGTAVGEAAVRMAVANGLALLMLDVGTGFHFVLVDAVSGSTFELADPHFIEPVRTGWDQVGTAYGNGGIAQAWRVHKR
jgi:hypothetical protein